MVCVFLEEYKHLCICLVFTIKNFIFAWLSCEKEEHSFFGESHSLENGGGK
jgi:uncharacterized membrane protein